MSNNKQKIAILTLGDKVDFDSYQKADFERMAFESKGFNYVTISYSSILSGHFPTIPENKIIIFLFFPFKYWNKSIEHKNYKGVYGNRIFYKKFVDFWDKIEKKIKKYYKGKQICFINDPKLCAAYRDKLTVGKKLAKNQINQPQMFKISDVSKIQDKLVNGQKLFIKPRYGSMGKGITFLSESNWQTNFSFKQNRIISRKSDYGWFFNDVTGNHDFLKQLLTKDIFIEKGLDQFLLNGNMVDLRIYTFLNDVIYIYPRKNKPDRITTNISQGGKGDRRILKFLPKKLTKKAEQVATDVSKALNLGLAGIDVILDRTTNEVYVVDVNVFPGFPKRKSFNLAKHMAQELGELQHNGKLKFQSI